MEEVKARLGRIYVLVAILGVLTLVLVGVLMEVRVPFLASEHDDVIDVVALFPITGNGAETGANLRDATNLAVEEINAESPSHVLRLQIIDTGTDPERAAELFEDVVEQKKPDLVVSALSSTATQLAPLADEYEVPLFMLVTSSPSVTQGHPWVFRYWPLAEEQIEPLRSVMVEEQLESLLVLTQNDEFGLAIRDAATDLTSDLNIASDVHIFEIADGITDEYLTIAQDYDGVYVSGFAGLIAPFVEELEEDYPGLIFTTAGLTSPDLRDAFTDRKFYAAAPLIYNENYIFSAGAQERFMEAYGRSMDQTTATAYDLMYMLESAMGGEGEISPTSVRQRFQRGFTYPSIFGSVTIERRNHDITYPLLPILYNANGIEYVY